MSNFILEEIRRSLGDTDNETPFDELPGLASVTNTGLRNMEEINKNLCSLIHIQSAVIANSVRIEPESDFWHVLYTNEYCPFCDATVICYAGSLIVFECSFCQAAFEEMDA
jgi:hypothetical protein